MIWFQRSLNRVPFTSTTLKQDTAKHNPLSMAPPALLQQLFPLHTFRPQCKQEQNVFTHPMGLYVNIWGLISTAWGVTRAFLNGKCVTMKVSYDLMLVAVCKVLEYWCWFPPLIPCINSDKLMLASSWQAIHRKSIYQKNELFIYAVQLSIGDEFYFSTCHLSKHNSIIMLISLSEMRVL